MIFWCKSCHLLFLCLSIFLLSSGNVCAEPEIRWSRTYGGPEDDMAYSVEQTKDGGYIIAGETRSFGAGERDAYLVKTDANGKELWSRTFGYLKNDSARTVHQTTDGGYVIAGTITIAVRGDTDLYLVKTNSKGDEEWSRSYGSFKNETGMDVQATKDGGYIIVGSTMAESSGGPDVSLLKTDAKGNEIWRRSYEGRRRDVGRAVQETRDGGYIIAGYADSMDGGAEAICVIRTDANGNEMWSRNYGGKAGDGAAAIIETRDGGYIIAGYTLSFGAGNSDAYLLKIGGKGEEVWQRTFGGKKNDEARSVSQTRDGGYILAGYTESSGGGNKDIYIVKTDSKGREEWSKVVGGQSMDDAYSVQQTLDGGYIVVGYTPSGRKADIRLIRIDRE